MMRQIITLVLGTTLAWSCLAMAGHKKAKSLDEEFDEAISDIQRTPDRPTCRKLHASYNLDEANLPLCNTRAPASAAISMTFDQYMAENAGHPALTGKIKDHQQAFVETAKPASINFGSEPAAAPAPDPSATAAAAAAAALAGAGYVIPGAAAPATQPAAAAGPVR